MAGFQEGSPTGLLGGTAFGAVNPVSVSIFASGSRGFYLPEWATE
jgi:hypothetical protein